MLLFAVVKWLIDVVGNRFWLAPSLGGLPKNVHFFETEIESETPVV